MNPQDIAAVASAVTALTQLVKWAGLPDRAGPLAVLTFSALGIVIWGWSRGSFERANAFDYTCGWIVVALTSAGAFGFTRAANTAVTAAKAPPTDGAGGSFTQKS